MPQQRNLEPDPITKRNVHIYHNDGSFLGGLQFGGRRYITHSSFYRYCGMFIEAADSSIPWRLYRLCDDASNTPISIIPDQSLLQPGSYIVLTEHGQPIDARVTADIAPRRVLSHSVSTRRLAPLQRHFRDAVRQRDQVCAITGFGGTDLNEYEELQAAHVFPVAREGSWIQNRFQDVTTDPSPPNMIGYNRIYSPQNGLLLHSAIHGLFDQFNVTIDPKDNYRIVTFINIPLDVAGKFLGRTATRPLNMDHKINDDVLEWHLRQTVLTCMKGGGQNTTWEDDEDLGGDDMGTIMQGPYAAEHMEVELFGRLGMSDANCHRPTVCASQYDGPSASDNENKDRSH